MRVERNGAQWGMCAHVPVQASAGDCVSSCVRGNTENRNNQEFQKEGTQVALTKTSQNSCRGRLHWPHPRVPLRCRVWLGVWGTNLGVNSRGGEQREQGVGGGRSCPRVGRGRPGLGGGGSNRAELRRGVCRHRYRTSNVTSHLCGGHSPRSRGPQRAQVSRAVTCALGVR